MDIFIHEWHMDLTAMIIATILLLFHYRSNGRRFKAASSYFIAGLALLLLVTQSPVEFLGHNYLFSAHMLEHVTLLLIIPPMLLAGTDGRLIEIALQNSAFRNKIVQKRGKTSQKVVFCRKFIFFRTTSVSILL